MSTRTPLPTVNERDTENKGSSSVQEDLKHSVKLLLF
uniref:Microtubule affinity regulating kinase 3 n=1 Tax=Homo sapiens TaxID=9606 RepID=A0A7I2V5Z7_HUMAN